MAQVTEINVARTMLQKGYKYVLVFEGRDPVYVKFLSEIGPLLRGVFAQELLVISEPVELFIRALEGKEVRK